MKASKKAKRVPTLADRTTPIAPKPVHDRSGNARDAGRRYRRVWLAIRKEM